MVHYSALPCAKKYERKKKQKKKDLKCSCALMERNKWVDTVGYRQSPGGSHGLGSSLVDAAHIWQ